MVRDALAGNVERGAVVHRRADDRQAQGDVDRVAEPHELGRDVPFVVVHGHHSVKLTCKRRRRARGVATDRLDAAANQRRAHAGTFVACNTITLVEGRQGRQSTAHGGCTLVPTDLSPPA